MPSKRPHHSQIFSRRFVLGRGKALLAHPLFIFLTIGGNGLVVVCAGVFYGLEYGTNPKMNNFLDALWWAVQTVTTVGYGDISPTSAAGKVVGMGLMLFGTALFSAFTALFATVLLEPEITEMEEEVRELERSVHGK